MQDLPKPLLSHLLELRKRFILSLFCFLVAFVFCYLISEKIFDFLAKPLSDIFKIHNDKKFIYTGLTEAFGVYIKVSAFAAIFFSFPFISLQIWLFIAPALYKNERLFFIIIIFFTPIFFILGSSFAYYFVFPKAYNFFLSFEAHKINSQIPIALEAKIDEYLNFVIRSILAFGICFEMPILIAILGYVGKISTKKLIKNWRIAIFLITIISAVVTPPDLISMIMLAIPLIVLYLLTIFLVSMIERTKISKQKHYL
jgi:sec-independent protein translocase protein TatC